MKRMRDRTERVEVTEEEEERRATARGVKDVSESDVPANGDTQVGGEGLKGEVARDKKRCQREACKGTGQLPRR